MTVPPRVPYRAAASQHVTIASRDVISRQGASSRRAAVARGVGRHLAAPRGMGWQEDAASRPHGVVRVWELTVAKRPSIEVLFLGFGGLILGAYRFESGSPLHVVFLSFSVNSRRRQQAHGVGVCC